MRVRRCAVLYLEPRERVEFDLAGLLAGGSGARRHPQWLAHAPHLETPVVVDEAMREPRLPRTLWTRSKL